MRILTYSEVNVILWGATSVLVAIALWFLAGPVGAHQDNNFDSLSKQLLCRIQDGKLKGKLTGKDEKQVMKLYGFVHDTRKQYQATGLNFCRKRALEYLLQQLDYSLDDELGQSNKESFASYTARRLVDLSEGIEQGKRSGRLNAIDCQRLTTEMVSLEHNNFRLVMDGLSAQDEHKLDQQLDDIERDLCEKLVGPEYWTRIGPLDNRLYPIRVKIDQNIINGKLTSSEANNLNREFGRLRYLEDRWSTPDGYVTSWEGSTLFKLAELLGRTVDFKVANKLKTTPGITMDGNSHDQVSDFQTPCLWYPSRQGGYYDASGQVNGVILGSQVHKYGGVMADGMPVPLGKDVDLYKLP
ncbi:MAG: hypothetical protein HY711_05170 [Candidatus Melainabacteria bacterium]|nr:hypothetical protein [Candidatus Melainabacteria bacterium]